MSWLENLSRRITQVYVVFLDSNSQEIYSGFPWGIFSTEDKCKHAIELHFAEFERLNLKARIVTYELDHRLKLPLVKYWRVKDNVRVSQVAIQDSLANKDSDAKV